MYLPFNLMSLTDLVSIPAKIYKINDKVPIKQMGHLIDKTSQYVFRGYCYFLFIRWS